MTTTRSGRGSGSTKSSPVQRKRKNEFSPNSNKKRSLENSSSPASKRSRKGKKGQMTIEESMDGIEKDENIEKQIDGGEKVKNEAEDQDMNDVEDAEDASKKSAGGTNDKKTNGSNGKKSKIFKDNKKNAFDQVKSDDTDIKKVAQKEQNEKATRVNHNNESIIKDTARKATIPSSILEKGIVYFFYRPRVNTQDPKNIDDVARSHIVLRPLPLSTKLGSGPLEDLGNSRLIVVPKKKLPSSRKDRFLSFVENTGSTIKELREIFQSAEYPTKTKMSNQPAERPFAEGIYALTTTGRDSHLAYVITVPSQIGTLQKQLGLAQRGSFIISVKNPTISGPPNASLNDPAEYPKEIMEKFRDRRWMPVEPEVLNYKHAQILLIGEGNGEFKRAVEEQDEDEKDEEKVKPEEELIKLEEEDEQRIKGLDEEDPVFADLGLSAKEFKEIKATW